MIICLQGSDSGAEPQQGVKAPSIHLSPATGLYTTRGERIVVPGGKQVEGARYVSLELKTCSLGEAKQQVGKPESDLGARLLFPGQALWLVAVFYRGSLKTTAADTFFGQEIHPKVLIPADRWT